MQARDLLGPRFTSARTPHQASSSPNAPPRAASVTLSVSIWRISRARVAPTAARMAISRSRTVARASSRLATFTHAISSTKPTAPARISRVGRALPTRSSCSGLSWMRQFLSSGYCASRLPAMTFISACACSSVTPGLSLATVLQ